MKLHLPSSLRIALAACVACMSCSAYADDYTALRNPNNTGTGYATIYMQKDGSDAIELNGTNASALTTADTITFNLTSSDNVYFAGSIETSANVTIDSLYLSTGFTGGNTYTFNGTVTGSGDITLSPPNANLKNVGIIFTGDVAGYTGDIDFNPVGTDNKDNNGSTGHDVTFTNNSEAEREVNASSIAAKDALTFGGSSTFTVNSDTVKATTLYINTNTTFTGDVTATNLEVASGKTATGKFVADALAKKSAGVMNMESGSNITSYTQGNGTVNVKSGATISTATVNAGTVNVKSNATISTATMNAGTMNIESGATVSAITANSSANVRLQDGNQTKVGDIVLNNASVATSNQTTSFTYGNTITIKNSSGTTLATFSGKDGEVATYTNAHIDSGSARRVSSGSAQAISNAEINVVSDYAIHMLDLSQSRVKVAENVTLSSGEHGVSLKLGELIVGAGGKLTYTSAAIQYTGSINLTLASTTFTSPEVTALGLEDYATGYSTSALAGVMNTGASLTLSFDDTVSVAQGTDMIAFTLTGLTAASDNSFTTDNIALSSSVWTLDNVSTNESGYAVLYISRAVPEPTTATLSLLALAGLAARRRRK